MTTVVVSKPSITQGLKTAGAVGFGSFVLISAILLITGKPGSKPVAGGSCPTGSAGCCKKCAPNIGGIAAIAISLGVLIFFLIWLFAQRKNIVTRTANTAAFL